MSSDTLDRALDAYDQAWEQAVNTPPPGPAPHEHAVAAALRVMADDLRALCDRQDWRGNGHMVYARDVLRILDTYTGSES